MVVLHTVSVLWSRGKNYSKTHVVSKVVPLDRHLACYTISLAIIFSIHHTIRRRLSFQQNSLSRRILSVLVTCDTGLYPIIICICTGQQPQRRQLRIHPFVSFYFFRLINPFLSPIRRILLERQAAADVVDGANYS